MSMLISYFFISLPGRAPCYCPSCYFWNTYMVKESTMFMLISMLYMFILLTLLLLKKNGLTTCNAEEPLQGIELQEKDAQKD